MIFLYSNWTFTKENKGVCYGDTTQKQKSPFYTKKTTIWKYLEYKLHYEQKASCMELCEPVGNRLTEMRFKRSDM